MTWAFAVLFDEAEDGSRSKTGVTQTHKGADFKFSLRAHHIERITTGHTLAAVRRQKVHQALHGAQIGAVV